uniref:uncharacterized protein LOC120337252 n=1 Tax=Styela clava TaxID=7725 RepID=UPI00193A3C0C|nr:uncharacterized protein LOC120337252 [Styela clava]
MSQQRKLPSKRYSSYLPPTELSTLEDQVATLPNETEPNVELRTTSVSTPDKNTRRKSLNTLHFDALQNAVSKLSRIDDFDLEELGYGFFSDVFKVTHKLSGKVMVLKRNRSTNTKLNILREVQLMNRLSHPNILKFMGVCVHEGQLHALTEYINGGDLDQLVEQKNTMLTWSVRIRLAMDITKGLTYLHSMGIFHRDLTAKNCLVRVTTNNKNKTKYTAVVADLGLAEKIPTKPEDEAKLRIVGTPYCMAPEVLREKPYNERSDFFSFGIILCQLIIRTSSEPEKLPRSNDFGLQRDLFTILVKKGVGSPEVVTSSLPLSMPPNAFLQLAYDCCEVDPSKRPDLKEMTCRLEQALNEEKMIRNEKKRNLLKNAQEPMKRHSTILSELPSITSLSESSSPRKTMPSTSVVLNSDKENTPLINKIPTQHIKARRRSSSGFERHSRSASDISKELISHAASIIASSRNSFLSNVDQFDDMIDSLNSAFVNPFSALENTELKEKKLFDKPSYELMEMTFDLPSPGLPPRSPQHSRRRTRNRLQSARPKSLLLDVGNKDLPHYFEDPLLPRPLTPEPHYEMRKLSNICCTNAASISDVTIPCPPSPTPPQTLPPDEQETVRGIVAFQTQLKQALIRSMALSPRGQRLLSWWHNNGRAIDRRSLTSVLSIMTEKLGNLRRSISEPDLTQNANSLFTLAHNIPTSGNSSRSSVTSERGSPRSSTSGKPPLGGKYQTHVYPAYVTLPRKKKIARCQNTNADFIRKRRSRTSDDVFLEQTALDILPEEGTDLQPKSIYTDPNMKHRVKSAPEFIQLTTNDMPEINNNILNDVHETEKESDFACCCPTTNSNNCDVTSDCLAAQMASCRIGRQHSTGSSFGDYSVSSSSSSSGMSSTGIKMTLYSGMVSTNRRRKIGILSPPPPDSGAPPSWSLYNDSASQYNHNRGARRRTSHENPHTIGPVMEDLCPSEYHSTQRSNRDSGYNEDILFSADHSCDSQSSHDTTDSGLRSRSASSLKSVSFTNPLCATLDPTHMSTESSSVRSNSEFISDVTPKCKLKESKENPITKIGKLIN